MSSTTLFLGHVTLGTQGTDQLLLGILRSISSQALVHLLLALLALLLSLMRSLVQRIEEM